MDQVGLAGSGDYRDKPDDIETVTASDIRAGDLVMFDGPATPRNSRGRRVLSVSDDGTLVTMSLRPRYGRNVIEWRVLAASRVERWRVVDDGD